MNTPRSDRAHPLRTLLPRASLLAHLTGLALAGCGSGSPPAPPVDDSPAALAKALVDTLTTACPTAGAGDEDARRACADALTDSPFLRERMDDPFDWGGQSATAGLEFEKSNRTNFNPRIYRRLYLSTFMFPGGYSVEQAGTTTVVRVAAAFRNQLDPGSFPYPFWHSADKWSSYETARELLFFVRGGKLVGALRSADRDPTRPHRDMKWDGRWTWEDSSGVQPRVTLFSFAFSPGNPHVAALETAYRTMERELRKETCMSCHSPDNSAKMNPLELFSFPNQALSSRRSLVAALMANLMPPADATRGRGVADDQRRRELIGLALAFQRAGDEALAFEGEPAP
jgi:hypothetical protein